MKCTLRTLLTVALACGAALATQDQVADSTDIANQIVQQLQSLGHHKYPGAMSAARSASHAAASPIHYDAASYYDPYGAPHEGPTYIKFAESEPTMDPNITPSGINVNAALGYISYLVLLVLLQSAVEGVAARSRRRRSTENVSAASSEDLLGRGLELMGEMGLVSPDGLASLPQSVLNFLSKQATTQFEQKKKFRSKKVARMIQSKQSK